MFGNYSKNKKVIVRKGFLNGQAIGELKMMRYGLSTVGKSGCGTLAAYNALLALGHPEPLAKVIREMEVYCCSVFGFLGSFTFMLPIFFRRRGISCKLRLSYRKTFESRYAVVAFWTKRPIFSGAHIVFLEQTDGKLTVYNRYSNRGSAYLYETPKELVPRSRFMLAVTFNE